jgi:WD40 repeat protein
MSASLARQDAMAERSTTRQLDGFVVGCAFDRSGQFAAFGLGDGSLHVACVGETGEWERMVAHAGAILALAPDAKGAGFITGGDDGLFKHMALDGSATLLYQAERKWVEQVASFSDGKTGHLACGIGRTVYLFDAFGVLRRRLDHPSTVTGLAFDAKGKRIAVSHYNGVSLWFTGSNAPTPRSLVWKGSHIGVAFHPAGLAVVTAMQENALHGWRLADDQNMRMSGYPAKSQSIDFTRDGKYLASSGAEGVVMWPFFGGGPMGKAPMELAQLPDTLCCRVACHPREAFLAIGYENGMVVVADLEADRLVVLSEGGKGAVSALAWNKAGGCLAYGTESGEAAVIDLSIR